MDRYVGVDAHAASCTLAVVGASGRRLRSIVVETDGLALVEAVNPVLKAVFKGAAATVIAQMNDHPLHASYQRMLEAGVKPNLARLTLARRIAAIVLSMWKHKEVYDPQRQSLIVEA